jgi:hypothetical protein
LLLQASNIQHPVNLFSYRWKIEKKYGILL